MATFLFFFLSRNIKTSKVGTFSSSSSSFSTLFLFLFFELVRLAYLPPPPSPVCLSDWMDGWKDDVMVNVDDLFHREIVYLC